MLKLTPMSKAQCIQNYFFPTPAREMFSHMDSQKIMRSFFCNLVGDGEVGMPNTSALLIQSICRYWASAAGYFARGIED